MCHNEFVNVWSHIIGVLVFLLLLTSVWADVLPNQFWYAYTLIHEFKQHVHNNGTGSSMPVIGSDAASLNMSDPKVFIDTKIADLLTYSAEVQAMDIGEDSSKMVEFEEAITEVMYRIEGISHFTIDNFYTFDYLNDYAHKSTPSLQKLTEQWHTTFAEYDATLLT